MPLEPDDFMYEVGSQESNTIFNMTLINFDEELYSFGVWGRVFATDGQEADPAVEESTDSAVRSILSTLLLVPVFVIVVLSGY